MRLFLLLCCVVTAQCFQEIMMGPGGWIVEDIMQCDDADEYDLKLDVTRTKLNRTHDGFSIYWSYDDEINDLMGVEIDMYKEVEGGYKYYQNILDPNACGFAKRYAQDNIETILSMAGIDPPDCPVKAGTYQAEDFVYQYREIKQPCPYGSFKVMAYLLVDEKRVGCLKVHCKFARIPNDD